MDWFEGNSAEQYRFPPIRLGVSCRFSETNSGMSGFWFFRSDQGDDFPRWTMVRAEPTELSCKKAPQPKNSVPSLWRKLLWVLLVDLVGTLYIFFFLTFLMRVIFAFLGFLILHVFFVLTHSPWTQETFLSQNHVETLHESSKTWPNCCGTRAGLAVTKQTSSRGGVVPWKTARCCANGGVSSQIVSRWQESMWLGGS